MVLVIRLNTLDGQASGKKHMTYKQSLIKPSKKKDIKTLYQY